MMDNTKTQYLSIIGFIPVEKRIPVCYNNNDLNLLDLDESNDNQ